MTGSPFDVGTLGRAWICSVPRRSTEGLFATDEKWLVVFSLAAPTLDQTHVHGLITATQAARARRLWLVVDGSLLDEAKTALWNGFGEADLRLVLYDGELAAALYADVADELVVFSWKKLRAASREAARQQEWFAQFQMQAMLPHRISPQSKEAATEEANLMAAADTKSVLLLGAPGAGKTTNLRAFAAEVAAAGPLTPVFISLAQWDGDLDRLIAAGLGAGQGRPDLRLTRALIESGGLALCLDGLNEVSSQAREALVHALNAATAVDVPTARSAWIVAGRLVEYEDDYNRLENLESTRWEIQPLGADQVYQYLVTCLGPDEGKRTYESMDEHVRELCGNPLLLAMVAILRRVTEETPVSRSALYQRFVELLLKQGGARPLNRLGWEHAFREAPLSDYGAELQKALSTLAESMTSTVIAWAEAEARLATYSTLARAKVLLDELVGRELLFRNVNFNLLRFRHHTFQEYFASGMLANLPLERLLPDRTATERHREEVLFAATRHTDTAALVRRALDVDLQLAALLVIDGHGKGERERVARALWARVQTLSGKTFGYQRPFALLFRRLAGGVGADRKLAELLDSERPAAERLNRQGQYYLELGDKTAAYALLADGRRDAEIDPALHFNAAAAAPNERAERLWDSFIERNPNNAAAWSNRGLRREFRRDYLGALADFDEALRRNPRQASFHVHRARTLRTIERNDEAIAALGAAIRLEPALAAAHAELARALSERRPEESLLHWELAVRHAPHSDDVASYLRVLAPVQLDTGHLADAIRSYRRLISLEPGDSHVRKWKQQIFVLRRRILAEESERSARERLLRGTLQLAEIAPRWLEAAGCQISSRGATWLSARDGEGEFRVLLMNEAVMTEFNLQHALSSGGHARTPRTLVLSRADRFDPRAHQRIALEQARAPFAVVTEAEIRDAFRRGERHARRLLSDVFSQAARVDPFTLKNVVQNQIDFFGRGQQLDELISHVRDGRCVGVYGIHKIGKSSLLEQLRRRLPWTPDEATVLQVTLTSEQKTAMDVAREILRNLPGEPDEERAVYTLTGFKEAIRRYIRGRMSKGRDHRAILFLDEYGYLLPDGGGYKGLPEYLELLGVFKALSTERFQLIACGRTAALTGRASFPDGENPFYDLAVAYFVRPLVRVEADSLMQSLAIRASLQLEDGALEKVFEATAGHPSFTRDLGACILRNGAGPRVDVARVERAVEAMVSDIHRGEVILGVFKDRMTPPEKFLARRIAVEGPQPKGSLLSVHAEFSRDVVREALQNLLATSVLEVGADGLIRHQYGVLAEVVRRFVEDGE